MLRCLCTVWLLMAATPPSVRADLRLHPDNPHYFLETTTGKPVLIASHGNIAPTSGEIDYLAEIARNSAHGMTYARVWHWLPWDKAGALWPWARRVTPEAGMGGGRYDLDTRNPEYWRRVRDGVARCAKAGIYAEVMLFEACGMKEAPTRWRRNPWASDNNVNGLELPDSTAEGIPAFYDFASKPRLRRQQERYLRKMIDETISCPNVIYEVENEHVGGHEPEWSRHYGKFIKDYIASRYPASTRLVSNSSDPEVCFGSPEIDIVNCHSDSTNLDSYNRFLEGNWRRGKAMNVDELANGQTSYDALRRVCWTIVASGGHFHIEDAAPSAKPYDVARNVLSFCKAAQWDFVRAAPNRRLVATGGGYCMAQPGVEYLCYFPNGGIKAVTLGPGKYTARWWNPRSGGLTSADVVEHSGGPRPFTTPDPGDWVLHVNIAPPLKSRAPSAGVATRAKRDFCLGDAAWGLFHRLNREGADRYLTTGAQQGFAVFQAVVLAELDGLRAPNHHGHTPLHRDDPAKPNGSHLQHADYIIDKGETLGLAIGMLPALGDKWNSKRGVGPQVLTPANARAQGRWLAHRYVDKPICWILGGDRPPETDGHRAIIWAMGAAEPCSLHGRGVAAPRAC